MEFTELSKLLFGLVTAIGTVAVTLFNLGQTRKVRAELLEKLDDAVHKEQKHSATELFRLLHGLRMSHSDIVELLKHDECSKIIYALKKTPGIVTYKSGEFSYTKIGRNKVFRFLDHWSGVIGLYFFGFLTLFFLAMFAFGKGGIAIAGAIFMVFFAFLFGLQLRQRNYDFMVKNLIESEHTK
ncbi:hypothetical protein [Endozoicomonas sp. ALC020]|uniref:hypothetical protein n=1 Tax=unclassified Endozoicomonas TaxID=2644528 RepID=UPI003BAFB626